MPPKAKAFTKAARTPRSRACRGVQSRSQAGSGSTSRRVGLTTPVLSAMTAAKVPMAPEAPRVWPNWDLVEVTETRSAAAPRAVRLEVEDSSLRRLEITYFALSVMTFALLLFGKYQDKDKLLDDVAIAVLKKSMPSSGETISLAEVVAEYQSRFQEYNGMLGPLLKGQEAQTPNPYVTILVHAFECVTTSSARGSMIKIAGLSSFVEQFVVDNVSFVKSENEPS